MSIVSLIRGFTKKKEPTSSPVFGEDASFEVKVILYLKSLINREDLVKETLRKFEERESLPEEARQQLYLKTYFGLEEFIVNNKPPIVKFISTKEAIRQAIREHFAIYQAPLSFRLIFLLDNEQSLALFEIVSSDFVRKILTTLGADHLEKAVLQFTKGSVLEDVKVSGDDLDFWQVYPEVKQVDKTQLLGLLKNFYVVLHQEIIKSFGKKLADDIVLKNYSYVKEFYEYDVVARFLNLLPERILARERLTYLTREELEKEATQVAEERVKREAADKTTQQLKNTVGELNKTKVAMLNLLEDANALDEELQRRAEELQKFQLAAENAYEHIVITDETGKIIYANKAIEKTTGYTKDEVIGRTPALWKGEMPPEFYKEMWETIKVKKTTFAGEVKNKRKGGESYIAEVRISPILDEKGEVNFFVGLERDITSEKNILENIEHRVEERTRELFEEQTKLQASVDSLSLGFIITDTQSQVIKINGAAKNLLCISESHNQNPGVFKKVADVIEKCDILDIEKNLKETFDLRAQVLKSVKMKKPLDFRDISFRDFHLHVLITPIIVAKNNFEVIGSVVVVEDITEEKVLQRSRDEFFSIASHELRTPLTAIRGNAALIEQFYGATLKDPQLKEMIGDIHESSVRLIEIVNDFLDSSRLEQGRMQFKIVPFDVPTLVQDVLKEYQVTGSRRQLHLEYIPSQVALPAVAADRDKVKQVLINLIGNALKFTDHGGVTISASVEGRSVKVLVTDTGGGISKENQKLLFRKFQQAGNSLITRDATRGTGLGLYISKLIMEGMGGSIKLEKSEVDKGTTFSFSLPVGGTLKEEAVGNLTVVKAN